MKYGVLVNPGARARLVIETNAAHQQRIRITGPNYDRTVTGAGEGATILDEYVGYGAFIVVNEARASAANAWSESTAKQFSSTKVGFDDSHADGDYNDVIAALM